jgi:hypothetical protein
MPERDWHCSAETIYLTVSMPGRTLDAVRRNEANIVVLRLVGGYFFNEFVIERLRTLSPRLFRGLRSLSERWRALAGGGMAGSDGPRGWLYRTPRWIAARAIGTAPRIAVEDAIQAVRDTIDGLLRIEDLHVVVRLPSYPVTPATNMRLYQARITAFDRAVRDHCEARRVPYYDWAEVQDRAGLVRAIGADGWHPTMSSRELDARTMSRAVAVVCDGSDLYIDSETLLPVPIELRTRAFMPNREMPDA